MEETCSGSSGDSTGAAAGIVSGDVGSGDCPGAGDGRRTDSGPRSEEGEKHPEKRNNKTIKIIRSPCLGFIHYLPNLYFTKW
jgi:hypothetical protein